MTTSAVREIEPAPRGALATLAARPLILKETLLMESEQRRLLGEFVKSEMVEGTDYGVIPGTEKKDRDGKPAPTPKSLLKPGAEKLTSLFRCVAKFDLIEVVRDFGRPLFFFEFRCQLVSLDTGGVVAEGFGSANSHESKYRYRNADRECPACGQAAIKRSKFRPKDDEGNETDDEPGWYCFAKVGGCGAQFDADDPDITEQKVGKVENPDVADQANSIMKIAKKRAHVDAAITLARCSDMFTQDVGDDEDGAGAKPAGARTEGRKPEANSKAAGPKPGPAKAAAADTDQLRAELREVIGRVAEAKPTTPEEVVGRIREAAKANGGNLPESIDQWQPGTLTWAIGLARTTLAKLGQAQGTPPPADPHPTLDREPGIDADDGTEPGGPIDHGPRLPEAVCQAILREVHDAGLTWDTVVTEGLGIIGRRLTRDAHVAALSLDEAQKVRDWVKARGKVRNGQRQGAAA